MIICTIVMLVVAFTVNASTDPPFVKTYPKKIEQQRQVVQSQQYHPKQEPQFSNPKDTNNYYNTFALRCILHQQPRMWRSSTKQSTCYSRKSYMYDEEQEENDENEDDCHYSCRFCVVHYDDTENHCNNNTNNKNEWDASYTKSIMNIDSTIDERSDSNHYRGRRIILAKHRRPYHQYNNNNHKLLSLPVATTTAGAYPTPSPSPTSLPSRLSSSMSDSSSSSSSYVRKYNENQQRYPHNSDTSIRRPHLYSYNNNNNHHNYDHHRPSTSTNNLPPYYTRSSRRNFANNSGGGGSSSSSRSTGRHRTTHGHSGIQDQYWYRSVQSWYERNVQGTVKNWPKIQCRIEPTTTLKVRKTFRPLKTIVRLSADFNTQLGVWQFQSSWEDAIIGGKLTLAGRREIQFQKSWQVSVLGNNNARRGIGTAGVGGVGANGGGATGAGSGTTPTGGGSVGVGEPSSSSSSSTSSSSYTDMEDLVTRIRFRAAVDLQTWKAYARVGVRTERLSYFISNAFRREGFSIKHQIPLDGANGHVRLEVKANFILPEPEIEYSTESQRSLIGMGDIEVGIEELNLLLDY